MWLSSTGRPGGDAERCGKGVVSLLSFHADLSAPTYSRCDITACGSGPFTE